MISLGVKPFRFVHFYLAVKLVICYFPAIFSSHTSAAIRSAAVRRRQLQLPSDATAKAHSSHSVTRSARERFECCRLSREFRRKMITIEKETILVYFLRENDKKSSSFQTDQRFSAVRTVFHTQHVNSTRRLLWESLAKRLALVGPYANTLEFIISKLSKISSSLKINFNTQSFTIIRKRQKAAMNLEFRW